MLEGVQILLDRMDTHPEEFTAMSYDRKWDYLLESCTGCLTEEEQVALDTKLKEIKRTAAREKFTADVMEKLMGEEEPKNEFVEQLAKSMIATKEAMTAKILNKPTKLVMNKSQYEAAKKLMREQK